MSSPLPLKEPITESTGQILFELVESRIVYVSSAECCSFYETGRRLVTSIGSQRPGSRFLFRAAIAQKLLSIAPDILRVGRRKRGVFVFPLRRESKRKNTLAFLTYFQEKHKSRRAVCRYASTTSRRDTARKGKHGEDTCGCGGLLGGWRALFVAGVRALLCVWPGECGRALGPVVPLHQPGDLPLGTVPLLQVLVDSLHARQAGERRSGMCANRPTVCLSWHRGVVAPSATVAGSIFSLHIQL